MVKKHNKCSQGIRLLICVFLFSNTLFAQIQFELRAKNVNCYQKNFTLTNVFNLNASKSNISLSILNTSFEKERGILNPNSEIFLRKYFQKYENPKANNKLIFELIELKLNEKKQDSKTIRAEVMVQIRASLIFDGDTTSLCKSRGYSTYTRSSSKIPLDLINEQLEICLDNAYIYVKRFVDKNKSNFESFASDSRVTINPFFTKLNHDTVYYQQRNVSWADFKGPLRTKSGYAAAIFTSFSFKSKLFTENGLIQMEITPAVYMDKNMSWVSEKSDYALDHEQLHFDITYLYTLYFLEKIKTFKAKSEKDLLSLVNFEYLEFYKKIHKIQEQYDAETEHSINKTAQAKWKLNIKEQIKQKNVKTLFTAQ